MRRTRRRDDTGATDPILIVAAIGASLALLVGGTFTVKTVSDSAQDSSAKNDLAAVAAAEDTRATDLAIDAIPSYPAGQTFTRWTDPATPAASASELYDASSGAPSRTNLALNPSGTASNIPVSTFGIRASGSFGASASGSLSGAWSWGTGDTTTPSSGGTYLRQTASTAAANTNGTMSFTLADHVPVVPGNGLTASAYVRTQDAYPLLVSIDFFTSATATTPERTVNGNGKASSAAAWSRVSASSYVPAGDTHMSVRVRQSSTAATASPGHWTDMTAVLLEGGQAPVGPSWPLGSYFDGESTPEDTSLLTVPGTAIPYDSAGTTSTLTNDLRTSGGAVSAKALEQGSVAFTPSDGVRVVVTTDASNRNWVAIARSATGSAFLRSSAGKGPIKLNGGPGTYDVPAGTALPSPFTAADVRAALANAGGF